VASKANKKFVISLPPEIIVADGVVAAFAAVYQNHVGQSELIPAAAHQAVAGQDPTPFRSVGPVDACKPLSHRTGSVRPGESSYNKIAYK